MGVYHQRRMGALTGPVGRQRSFDTYIIVNATATVKKLLRQMCDKKNSESKHTPEWVHTAIANSLTTQWKKRVEDLETELGDLVCHAFLFPP